MVVVLRTLRVLLGRVDSMFEARVERDPGGPHAVSLCLRIHPCGSAHSLAETRQIREEPEGHRVQPGQWHSSGNRRLDPFRSIPKRGQHLRNYYRHESLPSDYCRPCDPSSARTVDLAPGAGSRICRCGYCYLLAVARPGPVAAHKRVGASGAGPRAESVS